MEPRVSKREKRLQLSYELPHRIHCSRIYPLSAPNGSTVILYGHQRGLSVIWKGGKRRRDEEISDSLSQTNGHNDDDSDPDADDEMADEDEYEAAEEEQDIEHPFSPIVWDVDYKSDTEILHISTPTFSSLSDANIPDLAKKYMLVTVATSNAKMLLLLVPLQFPRANSTSKLFLDELDQLELVSDGTAVRDISMKVFRNDAQRSSATRGRPKSDQSDKDGQVLIAAVASGLNLWSISLQLESISNLDRDVLPVMHSSATGNSVSFHPSPKSGQLLLADRAGVVRIYDAFAPKQANDHKTPQLTPSSSPISQEHHGRWLTSFYSPFQANASSPNLARRKRILASAWILHGRGLLVLLDDGEWGIWDLAPPSDAGKSLEDFALRGYLDSSSAAEMVDSAKPRKATSKLAPMTPNTRKAKAEDLFSGHSKVQGVAAVGGVSVSTSSDRSGKTDESLIIWHNGDIYSIPSMQAFWQRSTNSRGGFGSLHAPGLTHISDINLMNELITSISQFSSRATISSLGQMNTQKDLLVSAEHRLIILQQLRSAVPAKRLFQQELAARPAIRDQQMLDVGDLTVDGLDRMLDDMADVQRPRRVGFAT